MNAENAKGAGLLFDLKQWESFLSDGEPETRQAAGYTH